MNVGQIIKAQYLPVHALQSLDLVRSAVLLVVPEEVCLPLFRRDAFTEKRANIILDVGQEYI